MKTLNSIFFLGLAILILFSCSESSQQVNKDENPEYEIINISGTDFENCEAETCPIINLQYFRFNQNMDLASEINTSNIQNLAGIFGDFEEETEAESYDLYDAMNDWI